MAIPSALPFKRKARVPPWFPLLLAQPQDAYNFPVSNALAEEKKRFRVVDFKKLS